MKAQIKTKDFQKIINPLVDGIIHNNNKIVIRLDQLKPFVEQPKQMNIFEPSENDTEQLLKNVALYIINSIEQKFISIDINTNSIIENGVFEYIKSIYRKESNIILSLPESDDNLLLIKRHNLIDISNDITVENKNPEKAQDIELGKLSSFFLQTKVISNEEKLENDKVTEKDRFFWKEETDDLYENPNFLIQKVQEILKGDKYGKNSTIELDFFNLIRKANNNIVHSDEFKLSLLNLNDYFLDKMLASSNYPDFFSIDFSKPVFIKKIEDDIQNKKFNLLAELYNLKHTSNYSRTRNAPKEMLSKINFTKLINNKNVVEYLTNNCSSSKYSSSSYDNTFSLKSCYELLEPQYKEDTTLIKQYISTISNKTMNNDTYINSEDLFKIPLHKFNESEILAPVLEHIKMNYFKSLLNKNNITNSLITDKEFLLNQAYNIRAYQITEIIHNFIPKEDVNKEFVLDLIGGKKDFYPQLKCSPYLSKFSTDLDIIIKAVDYGTKLYNISVESMSLHLLNKDTQDKELFKIKFLIEHSLNGKCGKYVFNSPDDIAAFNLKFDKLEFSFFQNNDWSRENKVRDKSLTKLKSIDDITELLDKIDSFCFNCYFDTKSFYKALHPELKNNIEITKRLSCMDYLNYSDLSETLQYNQDIALHFINLKPKTISSIPKEFFNDINFSLEFSKIMDNGKINIKSDVPLFITKFFENQNVKEDFYQHLKTYIFYNSIKENVPAIEDENTKKVSKKMKI